METVIRRLQPGEEEDFIASVRVVTSGQTKSFQTFWNEKIPSVAMAGPESGTTIRQ